MAHILMFIFNAFVIYHVHGEDWDSFIFQRPYVSTETGIVKGYEVKGIGYSYMAYLGIPYAAPPVGKNRFKAPLPANPWSGVLQANRTVQCPQGGTGDEDCLLVNVFTPAPDRRLSRNLPVLVFIHGGAFLKGTAPTSGVQHLLEHDVIVVTFNYRIGVLGFLCLGTDEVPGNAGMKDQVAALRWVQRNIDNFGGNQRRVTIYGTSAGGASVDLQVLSKMSNGLFRSAIAESGSATSTWPVDIDPIATATKLAETLYFTPKDVKELAKFYQNKSAEELTIANDLYFNSLNDGSVGFAPCIESDSPHDKPSTAQFLTKSPYEILTQGKYVEIPMMLFYSTLEGLSLKSLQFYEQSKERMKTDFKYFLPADLVFDSEEQKNDVVNEIKEFYFGNGTIGDDSFIKLLEYFGDYIILHGVLEAAEFYSKRMPVYLMEFSYRGGMVDYDEFYDSIHVAGHSGTSSHAFVRNPITNFNDMQAVERVAEIITNFVKYNSPSPRMSTLPVWPRVNPKELNYLHFIENLSLAVKPHWEKKTFWDRIYKLYRRQLKPVLS